MNCETCQLKELELEPTEIKDVLRCILHTIFFHRTLSLVRPKDVDCDFLEITYLARSRLRTLATFVAYGVDALRLKSSTRRWLVAPGAVGLCWCSEDRLGLEHHLVRLREHHGEHVHDGVPLLLCLRPWRCRTRSVTPASWNGLLEQYNVVYRN
ncbi:uncharacterized protein [Miscanthus floridulus]|uniref:uncharacterized protein n=1 Tax=Miscanthus floridulus TaxID=154761 RepID=UPI0034576FAD